MWAAFPPVGFGVLAFVAPAPLLWALRQVEHGGTAIRLGTVFGFVWFGGMLWWMRTVGTVAWLPLVLWMTVLAAGYSFAVWTAGQGAIWRWYLVAVGGWALWEFLRARAPFNGFPWGTLGYAAADTGPTIGAAQWIGATGWSVLAVAVAAGLVIVVENAKNWRYLVDPVVVVLLVTIAGGLLAADSDGELVRVAIIQGNSPCPRVHCQNENQRIYESHLELTRTLRPDSVDLVVWAENATGTPFEPVGNDAVREELALEAVRLNAHMLISGTRSIGTDEFENANVLFTPDGLIAGEYLKRHPVPFGEYVPLRPLFGFIPALDAVPRDMIRGTEPVVFRIKGGSVGSVISFEGAFSRHVRSEAVAGAELIVVTTNEGSFGEGAASDQLIAMATVNAAEVGMDLVHAAVTGKSAIVLADGTVEGESGLFTAEVLRGNVRFRTAGPTLFARLGDWLQYVAIIAGAVAIAWPSEARRGRSGAPA